jgi:putative ABC transport system permease protein
MTLLLRLRVFLSRLWGSLRRSGSDQRLREEFETHLELLTEEHISAGMTETEARAEARRRFGRVAQVAENWRDQRGLHAFDTLLQDVRFGVRLLARNPGFTAIAVLVLGLGIGVNNMLFTVLNAHTIRGLPIPGAERVVYVSLFDDRRPDFALSHPEFMDLRDTAKSVTGVAAFVSAPVALADADRAAERYDAAFTTTDAFETLGIEPIAGRTFEDRDEEPGSPPVVILSEPVWRSQFGSSADVIGRPVVIDRIPAEIIGVLPDRSGFPSTAVIWLPLQHAPAFVRDRRDARSLRVFGRLQDGLRLSQAEAEIDAIARRWSQEHPDTNRMVRSRVVPINERFLGRLTDPAWMAFMTVGFLVVFISCANVANLMLGRSMQRTREVAIRASLGASRARLVRQLVVEGAVLAALAGSLGLALAAAGVRLFRSAIPEQALPYWFDYSVDGRVLAALVIVSAGTVFVFALFPALHASKTDVNRVLKNGEGGERSGRPLRRWTTAFVVLELALAVVLLAQFAVAARTRRPPVPSDGVLEQSNVLTAVLTLPPDGYRTPDQRVGFHRRLAERLRALPGVQAVSLATILPLGGGAEQQITVADTPVQHDQAAFTARIVAVGPGYFETLGLPVVKGDEFTESAPGAAQEAMLNERFVEQAWGNADPRGRSIVLPPIPGAANDESRHTVVAVVPNVRQRPFPEADPVVYIPYASVAPATATVLIRVSGEGDAVAMQLKDEVRALDPNLPLYRMQTLRTAVRDAQWNGRVASRLIVVLTFIAVALAVFGLYAVTAHNVAARTREIGLRIALGAGPWQVLAMVFRRAAGQLALGFAFGFILVLVWSRVFATGDPDVRVLDWQPLALVSAVLGGAAVLACWMPAWRAVRLDPVTAIRLE